MSQEEPPLASTLQMPDSTLTPQAPTDWTLQSIYSQPACIIWQPSKLDFFNVKYGSLSAVDAFFATLPDLLQDLMAQRDFEFNTLENLSLQLFSDNSTLTHHACIVSKSDPDTLMYHEAMMATDNKNFVMKWKLR